MSKKRSLKSRATDLLLAYGLVCLAHATLTAGKKVAQTVKEIIDNQKDQKGEEECEECCEECPGWDECNPEDDEEEDVHPADGYTDITAALRSEGAEDQNPDESSEPVSED